MSNDNVIRTRLLKITALAAEYCVTLENVAEATPREFISGMIRMLPRLYIEFSDIVLDRDMEDIPTKLNPDPIENEELDPDYYTPLEEGNQEYYGNYIDEDYYNSVRHHIEQLLGPDDMFLETFEEDMKYSDTPIAASISEELADIFQPLYNFISVVKDTDGEDLEGAYRHCHEEFESYWSQSLCNVLRALNHLYYKSNIS